MKIDLTPKERSLLNGLLFGVRALECDQTPDSLYNKLTTLLDNTREIGILLEIQRKMVLAAVRMRDGSSDPAEMDSSFAAG